MRDADRQYENNNNSKLDNGVFNKFVQKSINDATDSDWESQMIDPGDSIDRSFREVTARSIEDDVDKQKLWKMCEKALGGMKDD